MRDGAGARELCPCNGVRCRSEAPRVPYDDSNMRLSSVLQRSWTLSLSFCSARPLRIASRNGFVRSNCPVTKPASPGPATDIALRRAVTPPWPFPPPDGARHRRPRASLPRPAARPPLLRQPAGPVTQWRQRQPAQGPHHLHHPNRHPAGPLALPPAAFALLPYRSRPPAAPRLLLAPLATTGTSREHLLTRATKPTPAAPPVQLARK